MNIQDYISNLIDVVRTANQAILDVYHSDFNVEIKSDHSPLTLADKASHKIIMARLNELTPNIPVISEEGDEQFNKQSVMSDTFWLVDPLDGTREFVARSGQFCVAIALIQNGRPQFGMFSVPTMDTIYYGGINMGSFKKTRDQTTEQIHVSHERTGIVLGSRMDQGGPTGEYIAIHYSDYELQSIGSMLKYALIAEGGADAYPCIDRPLKLWDVASGQAVIEGAGGYVTRPDGSAIDYRNSTLLAGDFVARSNA